MKFITYGAYVWFPVVTSLVWSLTLIGLLLLWLIKDNGNSYGTRGSTIVYISDVGANYKWLFIPGCVIVFIFYSITLYMERWLRHIERIPGPLRTRDRVTGITTVVTGMIGGFSLMMLSILDTFNYTKEHWAFVLLFIIFVCISSISQTVEIFYLQKEYPDRPHLKRNAAFKLFLVVFAICISIAFAILTFTCQSKATTPRCNVIISTAGFCEWLVSFILSLYFFSFILDLWPAAKTSPRHQRREDYKYAMKLANEQVKKSKEKEDKPIEEQEETDRDSLTLGARTGDYNQIKNLRKPDQSQEITLNNPQEIV